MVVLKKVGVIKSACFLGIYGLFIGVIVDLVLVIYTSMFSSIFSAAGGSSITSGLGIGIFFYVLIPLFYGVISFLGGLIFTPLMNLILKMIHGLDMDMVE
jgi:hypothetical protein